MTALSIHTSFEGIALGLQKEFSTVFNLVFAIGIHKLAEAISLGIALSKNFPDNFRIVRWLIFIFSMATPTGIVVGIILGG